jgi:gluconolactonase
MFFPNGIGLSPEEDMLYVAETHTGRVWSFHIVAPGQVALLPFPTSPNGGELIYAPSGYQLFDSLAVDSAGNVCVATLYNGGISVIAPGSGAVRHVPMPDPITTNICFGGPDLRKAFITLSSTGKLVSCDWAAPGLRLNFQDGAA